MLFSFIFSSDCIITACVNCFTSLFSGFVIFMYLGYMAQRQGIDIGKVAKEGKVLDRERDYLITFLQTRCQC